MIIYLVIGSRGQYSDHSEWPIKAFTDQYKAEEFVDAFPSLLKNVTNYYKETSNWYREQCIASGAWHTPTTLNFGRVRGALWDEKRKKDIEVERQYVGDYLGPKEEDDPSQDVPEGVSIVEVELV